MARTASLRLSRRVWTQLSILTAVTVVAFSVMAFGFVQVPALMGIGRYNVTVELSSSGNLYPSSVVNYRGSEVGTVTSVDVTRDGVRAVLKLKSDIAIPSNVSASVHSRSAVGEQFVELTPPPTTSAVVGQKLRDGDVIPLGGRQFPSTSDSCSTPPTKRCRRSRTTICEPSSTNQPKPLLDWAPNCRASSTVRRRWASRVVRPSTRWHS